MGGANHAQGRAIVYRRQRAGVAVVQDVVAVSYQRRAVLAYALVDFDVLVGDALRFIEHGRAHVVGVQQRVVVGPAQHAVDGPKEVDGGGARGAQGLGGVFQVAQYVQALFGGALPGGQGQAKARCRANGRRATDDHGLDGRGDVVIVGVLVDLELPRQQALVYHFYYAVLPFYAAHCFLPLAKKNLSR